MRSDDIPSAPSTTEGWGWGNTPTPHKPSHEPSHFDSQSVSTPVTDVIDVIDAEAKDKQEREQQERTKQYDPNTNSNTNPNYQEQTKALNPSGLEETINSSYVERREEDIVRLVKTIAS